MDRKEMKHLTAAEGARRAETKGALAQAVREGDILRLHVVANSDSREDQALKLEVRDAVLETARALLANATNATQAEQSIAANLGKIETAAREKARSKGYDGAVKTTLGTYGFPDRVYGEALVPAGDYRAVRVTLGSGQGANWWCVLYPDICPTL